MVIRPTINNNNRNFDIGKYIFSHAEAYTYLGFEINRTTDTIAEIKSNIRNANRSYYRRIMLMTSRIVDWKIMVTLLKPMLTYGSEDYCMQWINTEVEYFQRRCYGIF